MAREPRGNKTGRIVLFLALACILAGGVGSYLVLVRCGWGNAPLQSASWMIVAALAPPLLAFNLGLRFLRWRFLLRSTGARLPERLSLQIFLASFAFNFIPLYIGPTLYRVFAFGRSSPEALTRRRALGVCAAEVFYDAAGIAAVGAIGAAMMGRILSAWPLIAILALSAIPATRRFLALMYCILANLAARLVSHRTVGLPVESFHGVFAPKRYAAALLLSIAAWSAPPVLLVSLEALSGGEVSLPVAFRSTAEGALFGAMTASPGGAGVTGEAIRKRVEAYEEAPSAGNIFFYRIGTFWLAVGAGCCILAFSRRTGGHQKAGASSHFNEIAPVYDAQIPAPLRDRLLERKTEFMLKSLNDLKGRNAIGLDIGCGQGRHAERMQDNGFRLVGIDLSIEQSRAAQKRIAAVLSAGAEALPFSGGQFDFVYCINILHHLPTREAQHGALREIVRVLKPGGRFFLHEINTRNPVFRFYMGYVFPILCNIDTGEERWIRPGQWGDLGGWRPGSVEYYTFLPDFLPEWAARLLRPVERKLERSRLRGMSAHYTAVFIKEEARP